MNSKFLELQKILNQLNPLDVLSKSSFVNMYINTDFFDKNIENHHKYQRTLSFLNAYYMTHQTEGKLSMDYEMYEKICDLVLEIYLSQILSSNHLDETLNSLRISQDITSEILPAFKMLQINTLLEYQKDIINNHFHISVNDIFEVIDKYYSNKYNVKVETKNNDLKDVINNFQKYYDINNFILQSYSCKNLFESVSSLIGGVDSSLFSLENSNYTYDVARKCIYNIKGEIYIFDDDVFFTRFCKCIERECAQYKLYWNENLKLWTEEMSFSLFKRFLPGGSFYYENYYYPKGKKNRHENDILIEFKGYLIVVEVKGQKINPDPLSIDEESKKKSYVELVEKGMSQAFNFIGFLKEKKQIEIFDKENNLKHIFKNEYKAIIPIVITFEEMPAFLPDYLIKNNYDFDIKAILVNFYDLLIIFDYLNNPLLTIDYLCERIKINNKNSSINDELMYLGVYTMESIHLSQIIDEENIKHINNVSSEIGYFYFDTESYYEEIELYYSYFGLDKSEFKSINKLITKMIKTDYSRIDNQTFNFLHFLLKLNTIYHEKLEEKFNNKKTETILTFKEFGFSLYIKRKNAFDNSKDYYAFLYQYFIKNEFVNHIVVAIENEDNFDYEVVYKNSVIFCDKEILTKANNNYFWKRTEMNI